MSTRVPLITHRRRLEKLVDRYVVGRIQELHSVYRLMDGSLRPPNKKFLIFARGRSGSTLLVDLLNGHPDIRCYGELFRRKMFFPKAHLNRMLRIEKGMSAVGFKLLPQHLRELNRGLGGPNFLRQCSAQGWSVIYLKRQNSFRHALSLAVARQRNLFHSRIPADGVSKVEIPADQMFGIFREIEENARFEEVCLRDVQHMPLTYETDLEQPLAQSNTAMRIIQNLGLPKSDVTSDLKKVTSRNLPDFITNFDGLVTEIRSSRFERFVDGI